MARSTIGSLWDRGNRNELNRMLLELYEGIDTATGTKNKIDAFIDGTGVVTRKMIANNSVDTTKIADGAVDDTKLGARAVDTSHIKDDAVTSSRIAENAVGKRALLNGSVDHTKLSVDSVMMNRGKAYPLKSVKLGETDPGNIASTVRNAILDAKVYGAKLNMYYRLSFIGNGYESLGRKRYGITVEEIHKATGEVNKIIFSYNNESDLGNYQNATISRGGDIDTIIVENGKYVASITVDRTVISSSSSPEFLNLSSGVGNSPTAIIDPVNYSYSNVVEDGLSINKGKAYPLKSVPLDTTQAVSVSTLTRSAILDAKVFGAQIGKYYRVTFVANGYLSNGKKRYGITAEERNISDGSFVRFLFVYNDDARAGNEQNANIKQLSSGIDTIMVDNGEIAISVTVDRTEVTNSSSPEFLSLSAGPGVSPSAIIDPSNYSF